MRFIDNWCYALTAGMTAYATVLPVPPAAITRLDLADGDEYVLTLVNTLDPLTNDTYEIVKLVGLASGYTLQRGQQGTVAKAWPEGTVVFAGVTAEMLSQIQGGGAALSGAGVPTAAPPAVGVTYTDTIGGGLFYSVGTASLDDWRLAPGTGYWAEAFYDNSGTPVQLPRWAREIDLWSSDGEPYEGDIEVILPALGGEQVLERMVLNVYNDAASYILRLNVAALAARFGLTRLTVAHPETDAYINSYSKTVNVGLAGNCRITLSAGLSFIDLEGDLRSGLITVDIADLPFSNWISSPLEPQPIA